MLRLRAGDTRARLTYKDGERLSGEYGSSRFEAEVEVSDFANMETILAKLGYHPVMVGRVPHHLRAARRGSHARRDALRQFRRDRGRRGGDQALRRGAGLHDARRMAASYTVLFKFVKRHLGLDFADLTFENFKGIAVP
ncbi:MAG: hypothetical protein U0703_21645 [Anaerolineae bacterium]